MKIKSLMKDKNGVFGLTAIQQFFVIILGIALLAYIIVVIMGTLSESSILPSITGTPIVNESYAADSTYKALAANTNIGCTITSITIRNNTGNLLSAGNYSYSGCLLTNLSGLHTSSGWNVSYDYTYYSTSQKQTRDILGNTSGGVSSFFGNINPVYAILAVLVIILVLVVLVRVVQAPNRTGSTQL